MMSQTKVKKEAAKAIGEAWAIGFRKSDVNDRRNYICYVEDNKALAKRTLKRLKEEHLDVYCDAVVFPINWEEA